MEKYKIWLIILGTMVAFALVLTSITRMQLQPMPSESLIAKAKRVADFYGSGVRYEISSWTDNEAWASIYLEAENGRIPFENIYFQRTDEEWEIRSSNHWLVPSPSRALPIMDFKIHTVTVSTPEFPNIPCLAHLIPVVKNSSRWPAFVASVELRLENSTNRYVKSYSPVGRSVDGIVNPWETTEIWHDGRPAPLTEWYEYDNLPPATKFLRMDRLEGKTFEVTITLKDGEGTVLAENTFNYTF